MRVFITDADYKHTLGAIRSLGQKNIYVIAGFSSKNAQSFWSKYCKEKVVYPSNKNEDVFLQFMLNYVKKNKIDVLLPIGYLNTKLFSKNKEEFSKYTNLPIADYKSMEVASLKDKTLDLAKNIGIKIPIAYKNIKEIENFPIVVKSIKESGKVRYVNSLEDLKKINLSEHIIQEYIPGEGYGLFALYNKGEVRAFFMHKRIREYPTTGGPSCVAESIYDPKLKELGLRLLDALDWHGVAMVEFKKDRRNGEFKLMEINPKFWGSLDLSITSGIDFPYLTVKMATEGDIKPVTQYRIGIKFRWLFPDDFLYLLTKPHSAGQFFNDFFDKNIYNNIWLNDINPNIFQFGETITILLNHIKNKF